MITLEKIQPADFPESVRRAILSWSDKQIIIDETLLTPAQQVKLKEYFAQTGYKQV